MNALTEELHRMIQNGDALYDKKDLWRLGFHAMPPRGWMNDPNGLCQVNGVYHLFFQYSPENVCGGLKYWGHLISTNLLHWTYRGIAIYPDQYFDCHGAYSGSALVEDGSVYLYYTGNVKLDGDYDYINDGRQGNTALVVMDEAGAFSNKQLLMTNEDYPEGLTCHVRDPKVWAADGFYYMVQGCRTQENIGKILVFRSDDKIHWSYFKTIESEAPFGYMWECPDLFVLDGRQVLIFSPQGVAQQGIHYANIYQSVYCFIEGDYRGEMRLGEFHELDRGFDFYAPQTFENEAGERIMIGWMGMPDAPYTAGSIPYGWQHAMTLPRVLSIKDGRLCQTPAKTLQALRADEHTCAYVPGLCWEAWGMCGFAFKPETGKDFEIVIDGALHLSFNKTDSVFSMDFTDRDTQESIGCGRDIRSVRLSELDKVEVILDTSSAEVFINDGTEVMTTRLYAPVKGHHFKALAGAGSLCRWNYKTAGSI